MCFFLALNILWAPLTAVLAPPYYKCFAIQTVDVYSHRDVREASTGRKVCQVCVRVKVFAYRCNYYESQDKYTVINDAMDLSNVLSINKVSEFLHTDSQDCQTLLQTQRYGNIEEFGVHPASQSYFYDLGMALQKERAEKMKKKMETEEGRTEAVDQMLDMQTGQAGGEAMPGGSGGATGSPQEELGVSTQSSVDSVAGGMSTQSTQNIPIMPSTGGVQPTSQGVEEVKPIAGSDTPAQDSQEQQEMVSMDSGQNGQPETVPEEEEEVHAEKEQVPAENEQVPAEKEQVPDEEMDTQQNQQEPPPVNDSQVQETSAVEEQQQQGEEQTTQPVEEPQSQPVEEQPAQQERPPVNEQPTDTPAAQAQPEGEVSSNPEQVQSVDAQQEETAPGVQEQTNESTTPPQDQLADTTGASQDQTADTTTPPENQKADITTGQQADVQQDQANEVPPPQDQQNDTPVTQEQPVENPDDAQNQQANTPAPSEEQQGEPVSPPQDQQDENTPASDVQPPGSDDTTPESEKPNDQASGGENATGEPLRTEEQAAAGDNVAPDQDKKDETPPEAQQEGEATSDEKPKEETPAENSSRRLLEDLFYTEPAPVSHPIPFLSGKSPKHLSGNTSPRQLSDYQQYTGWKSHRTTGLFWIRHYMIIFPKPASGKMRLDLVSSNYNRQIYTGWKPACAYWENVHQDLLLKLSVQTRRMIV